MGLDMNLTKRTYVRNWDHMKPGDRHTVTVKKGGKKVSTIKPERIEYIIEAVGYWRKANAIHSWFVQNVQDGEDDCKEYYVDSDKLQELINLCKRVIKASKLVKGKIQNGSRYEKWQGNSYHGGWYVHQKS